MLLKNNLRSLRPKYTRQIVHFFCLEVWANPFKLLMNALFQVCLWCLTVKQTFTSPLTRLHSKACTVYAACHSSTNVPQSRHAASRNNESQQFKQNTLRPIGTERTDHPRHSAFMLWICACRRHRLTCMGCMLCFRGCLWSFPFVL